MPINKFKNLRFRTAQYRARGDKIFFLSEQEMALIEKEERSDRLNLIKNYFKKWPGFYGFLFNVLSPVLLNNKGLKTFLKSFQDNQVIINLGSGVKRINNQILNLDIFPFKEVDIVADMRNLPLADNSVDGIICEYVLEHIDEAEQVVKEIKRVTRPGGLVYIATPFIYGAHPSPDDYQRWTLNGLRRLGNSFQEIEAGVCAGPTSGLLAVLHNWLALILSFGFKPLYRFLSFAFLIPLFPFKVLDFIFIRYPGAQDIAACVYFIGRK